MGTFLSKSAVPKPITTDNVKDEVWEDAEDHFEARTDYEMEYDTQDYGHYEPDYEFQDDMEDYGRHDDAPDYEMDHDAPDYADDKLDYEEDEEEQNETEHEGRVVKKGPKTPRSEEYIVYKCKICKYTRSCKRKWGKDGLINHALLHSKKMNYTCLENQCKVRTMTRTQMIRHYLIVHGDKRFRGQSTATMWEAPFVKKHILASYGDQVAHFYEKKITPRRTPHATPVRRRRR